MFDTSDLDEIGAMIDGLVEDWVAMTPKQQQLATDRFSAVERDPRVAFWSGSRFVMERAEASHTRAMLRGVPVINVEKEPFGKMFSRCVHALANKKPNDDDRVKRLGMGSFGTVVEHPTKKDRAIKILRFSGINGNIKMEAEIMKKASDIGVSPKFFGIWACYASGRPWVMIEMGKLTKTFHAWSEGRDPAEIERMLSKIDKKLEKLHSVGIFHNDIHGDNVMIDDKEQPFVVDYGWSGMVPDFSKKFPAIARERGGQLMMFENMDPDPPDVLLYISGTLADLENGAKAIKMGKTGKTQKTPKAKAGRSDRG